MKHPCVPLAVILGLLLTGCCKHGQVPDNKPVQADAKRPQSQEDRIRALCETLTEQTGYTEGYACEFDIHEHEPAKSLIAIGPACLKHLKYSLNDFRSTKAWWWGRSSRYNLTVSDVVVCILRKIGGREEADMLRRRMDSFDIVWRHACDFYSYHAKSSRVELEWYMSLMEPAKSGWAIMSWAADEIEERLGDKKRKTADGDEVRATDPTQAQLDQWIKGLGDEQFEKRTDAAKHLEAAGEAARKSLEVAAKSNIEEVRLKAAALIERLGTLPFQPFLDAMGSGDASKVVQYYAPSVCVLKGSSMLDGFRQFPSSAEEGPTGNKTLTRTLLLAGFLDLLDRTGKKSWRACWSNHSPDHAVRVLIADDANLQAKRGDTVLTVSDPHRQQKTVLTYVFRRDDSGRLRIVSELTDYQGFGRH